MMRAYNKQIIPMIQERSDKMYISDIDSVSPSHYASDTVVRELIEDYRVKNDSVIRERLVHQFGKYVVSIAKNYQGQGLALCDLISEGMIGLLSAIDGFDTTNPTKFVTYANVTISRQIREAMDLYNNPVVLPKNRREERRKAREIIHNMEMGGEEKSDIIDALSEVSEDLTKYATNPSLYNKKRLSDPLGFNDDNDGERFTMESMLESDVTSPDDKLIKKDLQKDINTIFKCKLSKNEAKVIRMFFGIGQPCSTTSTKDIGKKLGISGERARQLKESGLQKLRDEDSLKILRKYL